MSPTKPSVCLALTGSTSSGKTTLCALLSQILPPILKPHNTSLLFLHCDAYGKDFPELPLHPSGVLNAESRDSVHLDKLITALDEIKRTAQLPAEGYGSFEFIENDLARAREKLPEEFVEEMSKVVVASSVDWGKFDAICIVDGFMLYPNPKIRERLDGGVFLRVSKDEARRRRLGRYEGHVEPEEFWKTGSYFDDVVWPEFVNEHGFLFPDGDVEVELNDLALDTLRKEYRLSVTPKVDMAFQESLRWSVDAFLTNISREL